MKKKPSKRKKYIREIYNDKYYKAQEMLLNPWFKRKIIWLAVDGDVLLTFARTFFEQEH